VGCACVSAAGPPAAAAAAGSGGGVGGLGGSGNFWFEGLGWVRCACVSAAGPPAAAAGGALSGKRAHALFEIVLCTLEGLRDCRFDGGALRGGCEDR